MTKKEQVEAAKKFVAHWQGDYKEDGNTSSFWLELLNKVYGVEDATQYISFEVPVKHNAKDNSLFIDAKIESTHVLIEQKASNIALDKPYKRHGRIYQSAYEQALEYNQTYAKNESADYIITCNFHEFWLYDMNLPEKDRKPKKLALTDLPKQYEQLNFLIDPKWKMKKPTEVEVSVKAGELVGKLYDALLKLYRHPEDKHSLYSLNVLCVRLVFCLYAEDSGLFGMPDAFHNYLEDRQWQNSRVALLELFKVLDTSKEKRDVYLRPDLAAFPYVNGGLFHDENIEIPLLTEEIFHIICDDMSERFDWSYISPTIFGALFESTLNPETRRAGGMHYTSIENIHKVIDPLFLNDLQAEFTKITDLPESGKFNQKTKTVKKLKAGYKRALENFQDKLASLKFFDPACGSGNFLTETYLSLRRLENKVIAELSAEYVFMSGIENPIKVSISQFYGIEINDFAVTVSKTALWIAESQMMQETENVVNMELDFLPLKTNANIIEGNALRLDWKKIIAPSELSYIMGNPPFVGTKLMTKEQKEDAKHVIGSWKNYGVLDYVTCWYKKASDYICNTNIQCAFVSTNSICQGEQTSVLWKPILSQAIEINFAYRTFKWDSEASQKAVVHCVIVGFGKHRQNKIIFDGDKIIQAQNINPYLVNADTVFVENQRKPICNVPPMFLGCDFKDDNIYVISKEEREEILIKEPQIEKYIRPYMNGSEFIQRKERYCIWLDDASVSEVVNSKILSEKVKKVKEFRENCKSADTRRYAEYPMRPARLRYYSVKRNTDALALPRVSSQKRSYLPMGIISKRTIAGASLLVVPDCNLYMFGILESKVHMAWMRTVCGRMKSDYRYSNGLVYNTFPWAKVTLLQKQKIETTARKIVDARNLYPSDTLANLYDDDFMPPELRKAHRENDKAVMQAYGFDLHMSEADIVAELMKLYQKLVAKQK